MPPISTTTFPFLLNSLKEKSAQDKFAATLHRPAALPLRHRAARFSIAARGLQRPSSVQGAAASGPQPEGPAVAREQSGFAEERNHAAGSGGRTRTPSASRCGEFQPPSLASPPSRLQLTITTLFALQFKDEKSFSPHAASASPAANASRSRSSGRWHRVAPARRAGVAAGTSPAPRRSREAPSRYRAPCVSDSRGAASARDVSLRHGIARAGESPPASSPTRKALGVRGSAACN